MVDVLQEKQLSSSAAELVKTINAQFAGLDVPEVNTVVSSHYSLGVSIG